MAEGKYEVHDRRVHSNLYNLVLMSSLKQPGSIVVVDIDCTDEDGTQSRNRSRNRDEIL
jgi:hypothetical protein